MITNSTQKTMRLVQFALLTALTVILQLLCSFMTIPVLNVTITLSLVPIVIGAALFGPWAGLFLGFVLGLVNFIPCITAPGLMLILFQTSPFWFIVVCFGKTMAAGAVAGLIYRYVPRKSIGICLAALAAPVVNTGIFVVMMLLCFSGDIINFFGSETVGNIFTFLITAFVGINFLVEFALNAILCPAIARIIRAVRTLRHGNE